MIMTSLLTRKSANNLKYVNFNVFILYFCESGFDLLVDCMFNKFYCYVCKVLTCPDFKMSNWSFFHTLKQPNTWESSLKVSAKQQSSLLVFIIFSVQPVDFLADCKSCLVLYH